MTNYIPKIKSIYGCWNRLDGHIPQCILIRGQSPDLQSGFTSTVQPSQVLDAILLVIR